MNDEAKKKRAEYMQAYRAKNREKLNAYQRQRTKENPEKGREYRRKYWERKAAEGLGGAV